MTKYTLNDISMIRVTDKDLCLNREIPQIAIEQGIAHDTELPIQAHEFPLMAENFRDVIRQGNVEIWRLENPSPGCGALFLSPLQKDGQHGVQIDDIVVLPEYRRKGLGTALIQFTAALAKSRGLSFVAWECEEGLDSRFMYLNAGAQPRQNAKPIRLTKDIILKAINTPEQTPATPVQCTVSDRFSLFRTATFGITGYAIDPTQKSLGLQIENIQFENVTDGCIALTNILREQRAQRGIDFCDVVIPLDSPKHLELTQNFDAQQTTYSGNPSFLWELSGQAFENAATIGQQIHTITNDNAYSSSQLNAKTSAIVG